MIRIERTQPPQVLTKKAAAWQQALKKATTKAERRRCQNRYQHSQIKLALKKLFNGKCAYCESRITHIDYGHIEHFHPKNGPHARPDLTFEWSNLFLACAVCNGAEFKSDQFPDSSQGGPLVNPCDDQPAEHFVFEYDSAAKLANVISKTPRGDVTIKTLGLNRVELREYRSRQVQRLVYLAVKAKDDPEAAELLNEAQKSAAEYSAFAQAISDQFRSR